MLKPGVASAPGLVGKLAGGLADAGAAQAGSLDEASGPDEISPDGEAGGSSGGLKPKTGLGVTAVPPCCMLSDGIEVNSAGLGGVASTGFDTLAGMVAGCSTFDPAAAKRRRIIAKSNHIC